MTSPYPPDAGLTYEQALAIVAGTAAAQTTAAAAASITGAMSSSVAAARDAALRYAMAVIGNLWRRVDVYDGTAVQDFTVLAGRHMVEAQTMVASTAASAQSQILAAMDVVAPLRTADPEDVRGVPEIDEAGDITVVREAQSVDYTVGGHQVIDLDEDATTVGMFNRPARTQRYLESQGMGSEEARARAEQRMLTLVDGNLMLAQRLAEAEIIAKAAATDERVIGLRRVIHPELSRTGTCGLCIAASDRIYKVRELMPIHGRCQCTVAAVTDEFDPADVLNAVDLKQLYDNAGDSTNSAALKRTRYKINEHGELGPSLIPGKRTKTSRRRSAPATAPQESPADIALRHLPQLEMSLAGLRAGGSSDDSPQVKYHEQQIARHRATLSSGGRGRDTGATSRPSSGGAAPTSRQSAGGGGQPPVPPVQNGPVSSGDDPGERLDQLFAEQTSSATPDQRSAVLAWQGKDDRFYQQVQAAISGDDPDNEAALDVAAALDDLMIPLPADVEVWRGVRDGDKAFGGVRLDDLQPGHEVEQQRFLATSANQNVAIDEFTKPGRKPALLKIAARAGVAAVWIPPLGSDENAYQLELLFAPGIVLRILDVDRTDEKFPIVVAEVVNRG